MPSHMEPEELDELVECWECGETVSPSEDSVFQFGDRAVLCLKCAIRRGGSYDAIGERWTRFPSTADLPDERQADLRD
jgi:hypothetical protein